MTLQSQEIRVSDRPPGVAAAVFSCLHGGSMARRGRPPIERPQRDIGTTELRRHRAAALGIAEDHERARNDKRASYPLGILYARHLIFSADHYAGRRYAALFTIAVRPLTIASTLARVVAGLGGFLDPLLAEVGNEERGARVRAEYLAARSALSPIEAKTVEAVCVYEDENLLRRLLGGKAPRALHHLESGLDKLFRHFEAADARSRAARAA